MNERKIPTFVLLVSLALLITLALSLNTPTTARATIIIVNSTEDVAADDDRCTLREAIVSANTDTASGGAMDECDAGVGDDTIDLTVVSGTIDLTGPLPDLSSNIVLNGPGMSDLTVRHDTAGAYRIFTIDVGATVTISGLTISDGYTAFGPGAGIYNAGFLTLNGSTVSDSRNYDQSGGIYNMGTLTLNDCVMSGNTAKSAGGGIYNAGTLTVNSSSVSANDTNTTVAFSGHGGGIYNAITGTLTLSQTAVTNNVITTAANDGYGGGIYNAGTLTATNSTIFWNHTYGDNCHGGGIYNEGTLTVTDSTVFGNNASNDTFYGDGGGVYNTGSGSSVTLNNSTVKANGSNGGGNGGGLWNGGGAVMVLNNITLGNNNASGNGGGIYNTDNSALALNNCTVGEFNHAFGSDGGGIWNGNNSTVNLKNSIIAGNMANSDGLDCYNTATLTSLDHNLLGDSSGCSFTPQTNDQLNVDPLLGPLQDNGGPTETCVPLPGSPAIDAIPVASCADHLGRPINTDQRGISRPQGAACDSGAVEVTGGVDLSLIKTVYSINPVVGETVVFAVQTFNHGPLAATGVVISDRLPLGLTFDAVHASQGTYAADTGRWQVGRLDAGVGATLTLSATVDAGAAGRTITNTATISAADQVDLDPTNNMAAVAFTPASEVKRNYIPLLVRDYAPPVSFPLYIGAAIPVRPVAYQGELFYTTSVRIPETLPAGGRFYFSSQRDVVAQALVDDELVLLLGGTERFSYLFATAGPPEPAIVELPRAVLETLLGQTVTIEYRDVYGFVIEASEMWLIWVR